jgi:hypothetical protein
MVCLAISIYSFGATALIFCMMFIHIMEVDLFISYGQAGASFVSCRHTSFLIFFQCADLEVYQGETFQA